MFLSFFSRCLSTSTMCKCTRPFWGTDCRRAPKSLSLTLSLSLSLSLSLCPGHSFALSLYKLHISYIKKNLWNWFLQNFVTSIRLWFLELHGTFIWAYFLGEANFSHMKECMRNWFRNHVRLECSHRVVQGVPPRGRQVHFTFPRVHAKGVVLCERACFCLLSTF